jgi:uncharacterized protein YhaN
MEDSKTQRIMAVMAREVETRNKAIMDRDNAIIRQAFELGDQDRKIRDLEAKVTELQAGDLGRLRQSVDFQAMEIQRLKAALWYGGKLDQVLIDILGTRPLGHDSEDGVWCWCDPDMDKAIAAKLDAYKGKVAALTEDLAERDRLLRECQAERDEARRKLALKANAMLAGQKRIAELEAEVGALKGDAMVKTHYAAGLMDSVKALAADVERLKAIADHSNNLAQSRLEEAARLRKEVAELKAELKTERALVTDQQQAIAMQNSALITAREEIDEWKAAHERRIATIRHLEAKLGIASS